MKKNLTIVIAALIVAAMAIPASAAKLTLDGEYSASWKYDTRVWTPTNLVEASELTLNLTFTEGESIVAFLPLTVTSFASADAVAPLVKAGNWYFSYETAPFAFWVSNNDSKNTKKFAALGDPLGIGAALGKGIVLNANGKILGAGLNIYAAGLADGSEAYMGRATYGLPAEFTLGLVGAYTVTDPETAPDELILGADVVGPIPGIGGKITVAGAAQLSKPYDSTWGFEGMPSNDNYAYRLALTDIAVGPVTKAWASYTAVGGNFNDPYKADAAGAILNKYNGKAAAEVGVTVGIPVGIPVELTLGNELWMTYAADPTYNETTAEVVVEPLADLKATVSGAYKTDLDEEDGKDHEGYKIHGDVSYDAFGLNFNPYVDYLAKSYADSPDKDTVIGIDIEGNPIIDDLKIGVNASYTVEEPITDLFGYGIYTTDLNPGFVQSAKSQVAAVASYTIEGEDDPETDFYGYAGTALTITDALDAKLGVLSKDSADGIVASANLTYKVSESIDTGLTYTFRQVGADGWEHYKDEGRNYVKANVKGTVGDSTITIAYGVDGLAPAPKAPNFNAGKPWAYLWTHPGAGMNWQLLTLSVNVPF